VTMSTPADLSLNKSTNVRPNKRRVARRARQRRRAAALSWTMGALSRVAPPVALQMASWLFSSPQRHRRTGFEERVMRKGAPLEVSRGDHTLAGHAWGSTDGPTVLLVHGWSGRATQLAAFVAPLVDSGYQVVAFDLGAHGESSGRAASIVSLAEDLLAIDAAFGPFEALVAHSFGGPVTNLATIAGLRVKRLAYIAPPLDPERWLSTFSRFVGFDDAMELRLRHRLERRVGLRFDELDGRDLAPAMTTPLLVVHDEDDREVGVDDGEALAKLWPGARFMRTRGLGHSRILRDEQVVAVVTSFAMDEQQFGGDTAAEEVRNETS
jgi:pimeloyl-ACP methyl ester carboxylesterase